MESVKGCFKKGDIVFFKTTFTTRVFEVTAIILRDDVPVVLSEPGSVAILGNNSKRWYYYYTDLQNVVHEALKCEYVSEELLKEYNEFKGV